MCQPTGRITWRLWKEDWIYCPQRREDAKGRFGRNDRINKIGIWSGGLRNIFCGSSWRAWRLARHDVDVVSQRGGRKKDWIHCPQRARIFVKNIVSRKGAKVQSEDERKWDRKNYRRTSNGNFLYWQIHTLFTRFLPALGGLAGWRKEPVPRQRHAGDKLSRFMSTTGGYNRCWVQETQIQLGSCYEE